MSDEEKKPLKIEIEEEEETVHKAESIDLAQELRDLGKQLADTIQTAWNSEERVRVENELREGAKQFADELSKAFKEAKESPAAQKMREESGDIKVKIETSNISQNVQQSMAKGLHWLSEELEKLAETFTAAAKEKSPEDIDDGSNGSV